MASKQNGKKSMWLKVMNKQDWLKLVVLIIFSVLCWSWVMVTYAQQPTYHYLLLSQNTKK